MFLSSLSKKSVDLGNYESTANYTAALDTILSVTDQTNTMMWVGKMKNCPFNLCGQGQLLKHGKVFSKKIQSNFKTRNKWPGHIFLFQQAVVLCRIVDNTEDQKNPNLEYFRHIW